MTTDSLRVLVVSTQFPLPSSSGFRTRVHQLTRQIAARHDVTLLSFVEPGQEDSVRRLRLEFDVETVEEESATAAGKRATQLFSLASLRPFHCRMLYSSEMQQAIDDLHSRRRFDIIQLESSVLCTFTFPPDAVLLIDEHNIEYELFKRVGDGERSPARRLFNVAEYLRFRRFEQEWWRRADGCVVTSDREVATVLEHAPLTPVAVVPNGVDLAYFEPSLAQPEPETVVFNGLLRYRPNLDAANYLVDDVWPLVLQKHPEARLTIVGQGSDRDIRRLRRPGVMVTGRVPDLRPYLARAAVVAVPIRMGGGTRLKVVEALAMAKAVVSTPVGCEGLNVRDREHLWIADDPAGFASAVSALFQDQAAARRLGSAGRAVMEAEYSWDAAGARLEELYQQLARRAKVE